jgi:hypothetical protein
MKLRLFSNIHKKNQKLISLFLSYGFMELNFDERRGINSLSAFFWSNGWQTDFIVLDLLLFYSKFGSRKKKVCVPLMFNLYTDRWVRHFFFLSREKQKRGPNLLHQKSQLSNRKGKNEVDLSNIILYLTSKSKQLSQRP